MTAKQRFQNIMSFKPTDALPVIAVEPNEQEAVESFRRQGMSQGVTVEQYLGMDKFALVPVSFTPKPNLTATVLFENDEDYIESDGIGTVTLRRKSAPLLYYRILEHPVKNRKDWNRYKEYHVANAPGRYPEDFDAVAARLNASDQPVGLHLFPFLFRLGFYSMGMERFMTSFYEEPDLIHDMFEYWSGYVLDIIEPWLSAVKLDFVTLNEDLAYKTTTHVSPDIYREFWLPYQKPILDRIKAAGVPLRVMWSAGNIEDALPMFLDCGINCTWPLERVCGMDPVKLREKYGHELLMGGGIPKEALLGTKDDIDRAVEYVMPVIESLGYVPALDDMLPPETMLENYRYYIEKIKAIRL